MAHQQGCRVKHGRQRRTAERRSHGQGQGKRKGEIGRAMVEEAQGHSLLCRQREKMTEMEKLGRKMLTSSLNKN